MRAHGHAMRTVLFAGLLAALGCGHMREGTGPREIRSPERIEKRVPVKVGVVADPDPTGQHAAVPAHPYMAQHGASCMHVDPYTTNTYSWAGPLGRDPEVESRAMGMIGGECPTINFDSQGRIISVCVRDRRPSLVLIDPNTLTVLARRSLPRRRAPLLRGRNAGPVTSGGA